MYPVPFAREVCDLVEDLKRTCQGQPRLPAHVPAAIHSFQLLEPADTRVWRHARFADTFNYLRSNKKLKIPVEWQPFVPKVLHEAGFGG